MGDSVTNCEIVLELGDAAVDPMEVERVLKTNGFVASVREGSPRPGMHVELGSVSAIASAVCGLAVLTLRLTDAVMEAQARKKWTVERAVQVVMNTVTQVTGKTRATNLRFTGLDDFINRRCNCFKAVVELEDEDREFYVLRTGETVFIQRASD